MKQLQLSRYSVTFQSEKLDLRDPPGKQGSDSKAEMEIKNAKLQIQVQEN